MKILRFAMILLFSAGIMSCGGGDKNKVDVTIPSIILNSPITSVAINPGGTLKVDAILSDDVKLGQYVVKITPGGTKSLKSIDEYSFNSNSELDAHGNALPVVAGKKTASLNFDIAVKDDARVGPYTFFISVEDQSGNMLEMVVPFEISRL